MSNSEISPLMFDNEATKYRVSTLSLATLVSLTPFAIAAYFSDSKWAMCGGFSLVLYVLYQILLSLEELCKRQRRTNLLLAKFDEQK